MRRLSRFRLSERPSAATPAIWLFCTSFWWLLRHRGLWAALRAWLAYFIQGENLWGKHSGNHMAVVIGDDLWEAAWPTVQRLDAGAALRRQSTVYQFSVIGASPDTLAAARAWLDEQVGKPYDLWLFGNRALAALANLISVLTDQPTPSVPIVDLAGDAKYICYELAGRYLRWLGIPDINIETFGPPDLWHLTERGYLREPVVIVPEA